jgi:hypothetical protein
MFGRADTSFDLWVTRPDGTFQRRLATGGTSGSSAAWVGEGFGWEWSPNSKQIAVVEPDPTRADPESGEAQRLAVVNVASARIQMRVKLSDSFPDAWGGWAWSQDGRRIAFVKQGGKPRIAVLDARSGAVVGAVPVATGSVAYQGTRSSLASYGIGWLWASPERLAVVQTDRATHGLLRLAIVNAATGNVWRSR